MLILAHITVASYALAQQQPSCLKDDLGVVYCAPPGGTAKRTLDGIVCGIGQCRTNDLGEVICSKRPQGGVMVDDLGKVVCVGGCVPASKSLCEKLSD